jgi:cyclophilin family peptidyl-prolyl cis-trans isomerase
MLSMKPGLSIGLETMPSAGAERDAGGAGTNPVVVLDTSMGAIQIELDAQRAPISTRNFLDYVEAKHYDGLIFHRVISNFMIQGGGMTPDMRQRETRAQIRNEAGNGLKNVRGSIAMARTNVVDSATSQFFINVKDNDFLNHQNETAQGFGYAVFGKVIEGMDVVDRIRNVQTGNKAGQGDVPLQPVVINSATVKKD